ncbi:hypothetical protein CHU95_18975 [Niveispirillum lacus]|uniref:PIN domain-containing protein n=1 Tax=Niveispirillum lacus TaxID=1981099 RepID=A0A255YUH1_9PROT|nr:type II toxin-antitoxin system VapC family toxin [Niveispirillum lacus]OYQ32829.1 hypothetical protein CHU95_18975 [Niveispirillum lacus]
MPFVVDASVAAIWLLPDEGNPVADVAYQRLLTDTALVPSIWWYEMRNIFISNERCRRISSEHTVRALTLLSGLPIKVSAIPDSDNIMALARKNRLTIYDAAYLELAQREIIPLATLDDALISAAASEGVVLIR